MLDRIGEERFTGSFRWIARFLVSDGMTLLLGAGLGGRSLWDGSLDGPLGLRHLLHRAGEEGSDSGHRG